MVNAEGRQVGGGGSGDGDRYVSKEVAITPGKRLAGVAPFRKSETSGIFLTRRQIHKPNTLDGTVEASEGHLSMQCTWIGIGVFRGTDGCFLREHSVACQVRRVCASKCSETIR